jgi:hypothetical protein
MSTLVSTANESFFLTPFSLFRRNFLISWCCLIHSKHNYTYQRLLYKAELVKVSKWVTVLSLRNCDQSNKIRYMLIVLASNEKIRLMWGPADLN